MLFKAKRFGIILDFILRGLFFMMKSKIMPLAVYGVKKVYLSSNESN